MLFRSVSQSRYPDSRLYSTTQAIDYAITGMMADDVRKRLIDDIAEISNKKFAKK